jgi:hypothetical protein
MVFIEQFRLHGKFAGIEEFLQVGEHTLANSGDGENLFRFGDDVFDLLRMILDGLRSVTVGANAERVLAVDLKQVGGVEEDVGDSLVVHAPKINKIAAES